MEMKGKFSLREQNYCFEIQCYEIPKNIENVKFIGNHLLGKSNASVTQVLISNCEMQKVPGDLIKIFPNMTTLSICNSRNLRAIRKEDLKGLEKLKEFTVDCCSLEYLPGNLFEDMKDLEAIYFFNNEIKFIGENLLDGLTNLKDVCFSNNRSIDLWFDANNPKNTTTLEDIKQDIRVKCVPNFLKILERREVEFNLNEYNLMEKISKLERKLENRNEILDDIKEFADIEEFKDIKVKIEDEEFKLHKFILAARSQTFEELFTEDPAAEELNLADVSVEAFKIFIDFVYDNQLPQNEFKSLEVFHVGAKMKVSKLREFAAAKLMTEINPENAFEILKCADKHHHEELIQKSFEEFKKLYPTIEIHDRYSRYPEKLQILIDEQKEKEEKEKKEKEEKAQRIEASKKKANEKKKLRESMKDMKL